MLRTKQDFEECLMAIISPLKAYYTPGKAGIKLGHTEAVYPESTARMEAFARVLWGLAPFWACGKSAGEFDKLCLEGIINVMVPLMTLKKDICPTNGSATVLNTKMAGSPSTLISTSSPFSYFSTLRAVKRGKDSATASIIAITPHSFVAEPQ